MRTKFLAVLSLAALVTAGFIGFTAAPGAAAGPTGFAVDASKTANNGKLYSIDLATGTPREIGPTGQQDLQGLSLACDGTLYGVNRKDFGEHVPNQLVTIDTTTGAPTVVGPLSVEPADAGLTFGTDGKLYMADVNSGEFYEINKATAAITDIGPVGAGIEITGLATRKDGTIFGYDRGNNQLVTINTATGAATVVGPAGDLNLVGLDFDTAGTLWGISGEGPIVTFNTTTGADTPVATYNTDEHTFRSLALAPEGCAPATTTTSSSTTTASSSSAPSSAAPVASSVTVKSGSSSSAPVALIALGVAAVVALLIVLYLVRRRRTEETQEGSAG